MTTAVYSEQRKKANRTSSFMMSGLPPESVKGDNEPVVELCRSDVDITSTRRVGRTRDVKPKVLIANMRTEADARSLAAPQGTRFMSRPMFTSMPTLLQLKPRSDSTN